MKIFLNDTLRIHRDTSHKCCCSVGMHVDIKNRYITLHLLWYCILIGRPKNSEFKTLQEENAFNDLLARHLQEQEDFLNLHGVEALR